MNALGIVDSEKKTSITIGVTFLAEATRAANIVDAEQRAFANSVPRLL